MPLMNINNIPQRASMTQAVKQGLGMAASIQQMREQNRQRQAQQKIRQIAGKYDMNTPEGIQNAMREIYPIAPAVAQKMQAHLVKLQKEGQLAKKAEKETAVKELDRRQKRIDVGQDLLKQSYDEKTYNKYLDFMEQDDPEFVAGLRPLGYSADIVNELRKKNLGLKESVEYETKKVEADEAERQSKSLENYRKSYQMATTSENKLKIAMDYLGKTNPGLFTQRMISKDKKSFGAEIGEAFAGAMAQLDAKKDIEDIHKLKQNIAKEKVGMIQKLDKVKSLMKNTWGRLQEQYEEGETLGLKGGGPVVGKIKKLLASDMLQIPGFEATGEFSGQRFETALALSGIMTGQNRIIEGVLNKILTTLPEQGERASYASRKIEQSVRNMFGLYKAMTRTGIMDAIKAGEYDSDMVMETFGGKQYGVSKELGDPNSPVNQQINSLTPEALNAEEEKEVKKILVDIFGFVPRDQPQPFKKKKKTGEVFTEEWTEEDEKHLRELERREALKKQGVR